MDANDPQTRAERREERRRNQRKMGVSGASVRTIISAQVKRAKALKRPAP